MILTWYITIPEWGNATLSELIWLFSGVLAVVFCSAHLKPLWLDWRLAKTTGRGSLALVAWAYLRRELVRLTQGLVITAMGGYACWLPQSTINGHKVPAVLTFVGLLVTGGLFFLSFTTALMSWWDFKSRRDVQEMLRLEAAEAIVG